MLFFFKEKPVELVGFVSEKYAFAEKYNPVVPASKITPTWWKNTPLSGYNWDKMEAKVTVRSCMGIVNTFKTGYIIPLWSDLAINIDEGGLRYNFADFTSHIDFHNHEQAPGWYSDYSILKINSPWVFQISQDINVLFSYPWYHTSEMSPYLQPYGINDNIEGVFESHQFILLERTPRQIMIKAGTPLVHIIPVTEKKINFRTEVVTDQEYTKRRRAIATKPSFIRRGLTLRKQLK